MGDSQRVLCITNFRFLFFKICVQNQQGHKILRSLLDSNISVPTSIAVRLMIMFMVRERLLLFNSGIVNFVGKPTRGEIESIIMLIFVLEAF